jgi:hypothetical protein
MTAAAADTFSVLREEGARCRALWLAVLGRVVMDATRADEHGTAARAWLQRPDPMVLALLDLDAEAVAPALARLAEQGVAR